MKYSELVLDVDDVARLAQEDPEQFALLRRKGFGASDSSVILGVNKWNDVAALIAQKNTPYITEEEIKVGQKPQVRMGADLEPLILQKAQDIIQKDVTKPIAQYRFKDYPWLTVNYDGVIISDPTKPLHLQNDFTVCEAKCVSPYARKYWDWSRGADSAEKLRELKPASIISNNSIKKDIEDNAAAIGIPDYYYTQVQQQMIGTTAEVGYLAAMDVHEWTVHIFPILRNEDVQTTLICLSAEAAEQCESIITQL